MSAHFLVTTPLQMVFQRRLLLVGCVAVGTDIVTLLTVGVQVSDEGVLPAGAVMADGALEGAFSRVAPQVHGVVPLVREQTAAVGADEGLAASPRHPPFQLWA